MMSRYKEVAEIVLKYLEHRDPLVRVSVTSLLPRIAHFLRDRFVTNYLAICMKHILAVVKIPTERGSGFIALGEMAGALDGELVHYLPTITPHLHDAVSYFSYFSFNYQLFYKNVTYQGLIVIGKYTDCST